MSASIALHNYAWGNDAPELGKWLKNHHCIIERVTTPRGDIMGIRIPLICKHLVFEQGVSVCQDYDNRPAICRDYWCERAKG